MAVGSSVVGEETEKTRAEVLRLVAAMRGVETLEGAFVALELLVATSGRMAEKSPGSDWGLLNSVFGSAFHEMLAVVPVAVPPVPDLSYREGPDGFPTASDELAELGPGVLSLVNLESVEALKSLLLIRQGELMRDWSERSRKMREGLEREAESSALRHVDSGHGHVFPRADGAKARCGGPVWCSKCMADRMAKERLEAARRREFAAEFPNPLVPGSGVKGL